MNGENGADHQLLKIDLDTSIYLQFKCQINLSDRFSRQVSSAYACILHFGFLYFLVFGSVEQFKDINLHPRQKVLLTPN